METRKPRFHDAVRAVSKCKLFKGKHALRDTLLALLQCCTFSEWTNGTWTCEYRSIAHLADLVDRNSQTVQRCLTQLVEKELRPNRPSVYTVHVQKLLDAAGLSFTSPKAEEVVWPTRPEPTREQLILMGQDPDNPDQC